MKKFRTIDPRKGTEINRDVIMGFRLAFRTIDPRKGTETHSMIPFIYLIYCLEP